MVNVLKGNYKQAKGWTASYIDEINKTKNI